MNYVIISAVAALGVGIALGLFLGRGRNIKMPNARDWIGIATFALSVMVLWMMKEDKVLREDEFFQTIATAIITMGFLGGPVSWAYAATKGGGEAAESSARIAEKVAGVPEPQKKAPESATEAADQMLDAADAEHEVITGEGNKP